MKPLTPEQKYSIIEHANYCFGSWVSLKQAWVEWDTWLNENTEEEADMVYCPTHEYEWDCNKVLHCKYCKPQHPCLECGEEMKKRSHSPGLGVRRKWLQCPSCGRTE